MQVLDQRYRQVTLTVTAGAYASGQCVGGLKTLTSNLLAPHSKTAEVRQIIIVDKAEQDVDYDVLFFHSNPSTTTFTDNVELDMADADLTKLCGIVEVRTHYAFADNGCVSSGPTSIPIRTEAGSGSATLYMAVVVRGSATFASTSDLSVGIVVYGD